MCGIKTAGERERERGDEREAALTLNSVLACGFAVAWPGYYYAIPLDWVWLAVISGHSSHALPNNCDIPALGFGS